MAIKSSLFTLFVIGSFLLGGCQIRSARRDSPFSTPPAPGRPLPERTEQPQSPALEEPKHVAVILGPGGAKALAHVGVLKAFQQQRIPIQKIVGLEWGALIAALYAHKGQIHDVEWKLYKMDQQQILKPKSKSLFSRDKNQYGINVFNDFFQDSFAKDEIGRAKMAFACPSRSIWTGVVAWQNRGLFREALKRCLPFPPLFKVQGTFLAGASQAVEAVEMLAKEKYNVIVMVNVLGSAAPYSQEAMMDNLEQVVLWQEIKRAINEVSRLNVEFVNVDTSAYPMVQFDAKKDLILIGEKAGNLAAGSLISKYGF